MVQLFKVYLPIVGREASSIGPKVKTPTKGGTETILIAEDDEVVQKLAIRILENAGYTILTADNGKEAINRVQNSDRQIDMILLDLVMPELGGRAVYDTLQESHPQMGFLFTTGYSENAVLSGSMLEKGMEMIQKPYAPELLLNKVRKVLDR